MAFKTVGTWGGSLALRLTNELKGINVKLGEDVKINVIDGKIIIEKIEEEFRVVNGVKFTVKE